MRAITNFNESDCDALAHALEAALSGEVRFDAGSRALYGHLGQGCVHARISFDLHTPEGVKKLRAFMEEAADLVVPYGGSLSGEHGGGQARAELLGKLYGEELIQAFREFKSIWDPQWKMSPGKVIDPYKLDENLQLVNFHPPQTATNFVFPQDKRSFARVMIRCVGAGERVLLLKVRQASEDTLIIANGLSCREQIAQTTNRRALHIAQVLQMALHGGPQSQVPEVELRRARRRPLARLDHQPVQATLIAF